ncbi:MAG TPA: hypothetical protein VIX14_11605 [Terriglobales bacterium]
MESRWKSISRTLVDQRSPGTAGFVVTVYDATAAFTHWGMYNISPTATGLPENAGVAGSQCGNQILNDFLVGQE